MKKERREKVEKKNKRQRQGLGTGRVESQEDESYFYGRPHKGGKRVRGEPSPSSENSGDEEREEEKGA